MPEATLERHARIVVSYDHMEVRSEWRLCALFQQATARHIGAITSTLRALQRARSCADLCASVTHCTVATLFVKIIRRHCRCALVVWWARVQSLVCVGCRRRQVAAPRITAMLAGVLGRSTRAALVRGIVSSVAFDFASIQWGSYLCPIGIRARTHLAA